MCGDARRGRTCCALDYTIAELARAEGVSRQAIHRRLASGRYPGAYREIVPGGTRWRIPRDDVVRDREGRG